MFCTFLWFFVLNVSYFLIKMLANMYFFSQKSIKSVPQSCYELSTESINGILLFSYTATKYQTTWAQ